MTDTLKAITTLDKLSKSELNALKKEISRICEKQYRKGYQHGYVHTKADLVTAEQVTNFRVKGEKQNYSKVLFPPHFVTEEKASDVILAELAMSDMAILKNIFRG